MTREGQRLRALLLLAANTVTPSPDALDVIRARIRRNGVPGVAAPGRLPADMPTAKGPNDR